jgi:hypothetical protein
MKSPDARVLIAPGCPHCPAVVQSLSESVKRGDIGSLEIINIAVHPEAAEEAGTRSVPWTRIGDYVHLGALTPQEIRETIARAGRADPVEQLVHLLETSRLDTVVQLVTAEPGLLPALVALLADLDTPMAVRIGIGALLEELPDALVKPVEGTLTELTGSQHQSVRADAAHYLSLVDTESSRETLRGLLDDESDEVREIAQESLEELSA